MGTEQESSIYECRLIQYATQKGCISRVDCHCYYCSIDLDGDDEGLCMENGASHHLYFLSETRKFKSVVELVTFYSRNSLKESFHGLDTTLRFPIGEVFRVKAKFDFVPPPDQKTMLPLKTGDEVS